MEQIGAEYIFQALMIISLLLVIMSIPTIFITIRNSSNVLRRYMALRSLRDVDDGDIPSHILEEWNAVKNNVNYATLMTEELEKLNGLRPALFQTEVAVVEVAVVLMVIMAFIPGYEPAVLVLMAVLIVLSVIALTYSYVCIKKYGMEYMSLLREMSNGPSGGRDAMYG